MKPSFSLRPIVISDHDWLISLHNDPVVLKNLTDPSPISYADHLKWYRGVEDNPRQKRMIFVVDDIDKQLGGPAGLTKFYDIDKNNGCCTLGADIHKDFRGNGYAKHMWTLMLDMCFNTFRLHRVALSTAEFNETAIHIYKKLGFNVEGRLTQSLFRDGKYYDQIMMYMLANDWWNRDTSNEP